MQTGESAASGQAFCWLAGSGIMFESADRFSSRCHEPVPIRIDWNFRNVERSLPALPPCVRLRR
ncbi:MAG: hypothetical protein ACN6QC_00550, partial [Paraburkholderia hospita]